MPFADPTLVISIDRTDMTLPALVFRGTPGSGELGITEYTEPAMQPRNRYASPSHYYDGEEILGAAWQNAILGWDFVTDEAADEEESRELIAEVRAAISRLEYEVTITVDGAPDEVWLVQGYGTLTPAGARTRANLVDHDPVWAVTLTAYPTRTIGA